MKRRKFLQSMGAAGITAALPGPSMLASPETADAKAAGVFTNQVGYLTSAAKHATIRAVSGAAPQPFEVRLVRDNSVVFRGELGVPMDDENSGDKVQVADFSALRSPGTVRVTAGGLQGDPITIGDRVYAGALRSAMRGFHGQRCGCAIDLGDGYAHPACHTAGAFHPTSGRSGPLPNHGGWHDAGDYGRYTVNSGITTGSLLWAWEMYARPLRSLALALPESGGRTPDYLAEVRWNLAWMLQMQDTDGGVWHKQTSEKFCAFILPQQDTLTSYVVGTGAEPFKSTAATADLAAVMAIAARSYGPYDAAFAQECLLASRRAWTWASAHPDVPFQNPLSIATGGYGDRQLTDELAWASAELWRSTGDDLYQRAFLATLPTGPLTVIEPGWGNVQSMALWTYAMAEQKGSADAKQRIVAATEAAAADLVTRGGRSGYGTTLMPRDYGWGSNSVAGNQSLLLWMADHFQPSASYRTTALSNLHYLLGRNCFGVSWVTQLGVRPFLHPHHRPSAADGITAPWPGLLSGGPNAHGGDPVADALAKQPPMRMWVDDERAYSINEVAINWNAPLVFVLAAASA